MTTFSNADGVLLSDLLRYDLSSMSVPGSSIALIEREDSWWRAHWERRDGEFRTADFHLRGPADFSAVRVSENGVETSYARFMSGPQMANLHALARSLSSSFSERGFVESRAQLDAEDSAGGAGLATEVISEGVRESRLGVTNLVFVTGGAGGGKTAVLRRLVGSRAEGYRSGSGGALWLYVSAQGRRLAKLDDAVGRELGRMQAAFSFEAVSALVRCGVLVLVIDGFDELLGIAGSYDESFSSLASFLDELHGSGSVVAAARSAYYEQEFLARIDKAIGFRSDGWQVQRVRLLDWSVRERAEYSRLRGSNISDDALEEVMREPGLGTLSGKPFFVTEIIDLLSEGVSISGPGDRPLIERLVNAYLDREVHEKLVERSGKAFISREQLGNIFSEIAEEMWRQDSMELSRSSVRELVSVIAAVEGLDPEAQLLLTDRAPYAALLNSGSTPGSVAFEHDVYYSYFLSRPIVELLRARRVFDIRQALRRTYLTPEAADLAAQSLRATGESLIGLLCDAASVRSPWEPTTRRNAGTLIAAMFRQIRSAEGQLVHNVDFIDCDLEGVELTALELLDCSFIDCNLSRTILQGRAARVTMDRCELQPPFSKLRLEGLTLADIRVVIEVSAHGKSTLYEPKRVASVLEACSLPAARDTATLVPIGSKVSATLQHLAVLFSRTNLFTEQDDASDVRRVVDELAWPLLKKNLIEAGLLRVERRGAQGNKTFLKVKVAPEDLLAGRDTQAIVPSNIREFWDALAGGS